jgi:hypothetical protein
MSVNRLESGVKTVQNDAAQLDTAEKVLSDVYELLELYSPSWYSEKLRERMQSALSGSHDGGKFLAQ